MDNRYRTYMRCISSTALSIVTFLDFLDVLFDLYDADCDSTTTGTASPGLSTILFASTSPTESKLTNFIYLLCTIF